MSGAMLLAGAAVAIVVIAVLALFLISGDRK